jgi:type II secretory pathway pseudopilin PulG
MAIIAIVSVAALPTMLDAYQSRAVESGAASAQAALVEARDLATRSGSGVAGVRLIPDPAWEIARLADGTIDPAAPIAYSRMVALDAPPPYSEGLVEVHVDPLDLPPGFAPPYRRGMIEESPFDAQGVRVAPTSWAWNVRVGDVVQYLGRSYTVTGPTAIPIGAANPEGFVNFGLPGSPPPLYRHSDPRTGAPMASEWLAVVNRLDDDRDGFTDEGWDGIDNDLDGFTDEPDEGEGGGDRNGDGVVDAIEDRMGEPFGPQATASPSPYRIDRRPIAAGKARTTILPASVVIDATGWIQTGRLVSGSDARLRSQVPVDPYTGAVDLMFDGAGRVSLPSLYGRDAIQPFRRDWIHLWLADRGDVAPPVAALDARGAVVYSAAVGARDAAVVSIDRASGRAHATPADGFDAPATFLAAERGSR